MFINLTKDNQQYQLINHLYSDITRNDEFYNKLITLCENLNISLDMPYLYRGDIKRPFKLNPYESCVALDLTYAVKVAIMKKDQKSLGILFDHNASFLIEDNVYLKDAIETEDFATVKFILEQQQAWAVKHKESYHLFLTQFMHAFSTAYKSENKDIINFLFSKLQYIISLTEDIKSLLFTNSAQLTGLVESYAKNAHYNIAFLLLSYMDKEQSSEFEKLYCAKWLQTALVSDSKHDDFIYLYNRYLSLISYNPNQKVPIEVVRVLIKAPDDYISKTIFTNLSFLQDTILKKSSENVIAKDLLNFLLLTAEIYGKICGPKTIKKGNMPAYQLRAELTRFITKKNLFHEVMICNKNDFESYLHALNVIVTMNTNLQSYSLTLMTGFMLEKITNSIGTLSPSLNDKITIKCLYHDLANSFYYFIKFSSMSDAKSEQLINYIKHVMTIVKWRQFSEHNNFEAAYLSLIKAYMPKVARTRAVDCLDDSVPFNFSYKYLSINALFNVLSHDNDGHSLLYRAMQKGCFKVLDAFNHQSGNIDLCHYENSNSTLLSAIIYSLSIEKTVGSVINLFKFIGHFDNFILTDDSKDFIRACSYTLANDFEKHISHFSHQDLLRLSRRFSTPGLVNKLFHKAHIEKIRCILLESLCNTLIDRKVSNHDEDTLFSLIHLLCAIKTTRQYISDVLMAKLEKLKFDIISKVPDYLRTVQVITTTSLKSILLNSKHVYILGILFQSLLDDAIQQNNLTLDVLSFFVTALREKSLIYDAIWTKGNFDALTNSVIKSLIRKLDTKKPERCALLLLSLSEININFDAVKWSLNLSEEHKATIGRYFAVYIMQYPYNGKYTVGELFKLIDKENTYLNSLCKFTYKQLSICEIDSLCSAVLKKKQTKIGMSFDMMAHFIDKLINCISNRNVPRDKLESYVINILGLYALSGKKQFESRRDYSNITNHCALLISYYGRFAARYPDVYKNSDTQREFSMLAKDLNINILTNEQLLLIAESFIKEGGVYVALSTSHSTKSNIINTLLHKLCQAKPNAETTPLILGLLSLCKNDNILTNTTIELLQQYSQDLQKAFINFLLAYPGRFTPAAVIEMATDNKAILSLILWPTACTKEDKIICLLQHHPEPKGLIMLLNKGALAPSLKALPGLRHYVANALNNILTANPQSVYAYEITNKLEKIEFFDEKQSSSSKTMQAFKTFLSELRSKNSNAHHDVTDVNDNLGHDDTNIFEL